MIPPSARLVFREPVAGDAAWLARAWGDAAYGPPAQEGLPTEPEEIRALLERRKDAGCEDFVFVTDGALRVGRGSYQHHDLARATCEVELEIPDPRLRGRGFGTEALRAVIAHAFATGARRVTARAASWNAPSLRMAARAGLRVRGRARGERGEAIVLLAIAVPAVP